MQVITGFFITIIFGIVFAISMIGFTNEMTHVQTIDEILDTSISSDDFNFKRNSYIFDRNENIVSEIYEAENRIFLEFSEIPPQFMQAMIATEDQNFYNHKGFDMNGIARAFFVNAENQSIEQGGSTITQQLVKNVYLSNERTYNRKLSELLYAYQIEQLFSKEQILEYYLNIIFFQNGVYGIEAASQFYFSKPASDLAISEIAFLSAIPNNPTHYNPLTNIENTHIRKDWILQKMWEMDFISKKEYETAKNAEIHLQVKNKIDQYPDFVTYVHFEFEQLIGENEGFNKRLKQASSEEEKDEIVRARRNLALEVLNSGVHIYTALDPLKQKEMIKRVDQYLPEKDIQASVVMIDHKNQNIVAMTGGKDFKKFDFHRGFQAFRQPGSSIKPLLVFGPYLSETRASITSIINGRDFCVGDYCPKNYGNQQIGNVSIATAMSQSYNTAAAKMMETIGVETSFLYLNQFEFTRIVAADYRLPASLGGLTYGVSPLELTSAYTIFSHAGEYQKPVAITKVTDTKGNVLYEWSNEAKRVWDKETNDKMRQLLSKVVAEGTGRRAHISSTYVGGKTGTTNNYHDLWFIGLNEAYTTGIWIGKDTPGSLSSINNQNPHLLIWREIMK